MLTDAPTPAEGAAIAAHRAYLDHMAAGSCCLRAHPTTDASTFRIVIFRAESAEAARRSMADDPAVAAGVMRGQVFPFRVGRVGPGLASPV